MTTLLPKVFTAAISFSCFAQAMAADEIKDLADLDSPTPTLAKATASQDSVTDAQLKERAMQAIPDDFLSQFAPSEDSAEDPSKAQAERNIVTESDILCFKGVATLVPKSAVIHVPDALKERMEMVPGSKIVTWTQFIQQNRGWITSLEVKLTEATGETPFSEERAEWIAENGKIIVATLQGGPVSVLPPKETPEETTETASRN